MDLQWLGAGHALSLIENAPGATPAITLAETGTNARFLTVDLGAGGAFADSSTAAMPGLKYEHPGSPGTSHYATLDLGSVAGVQANLAGDRLTIGNVHAGNARVTIAAQQVMLQGQLSAADVAINVAQRLIQTQAGQINVSNAGGAGGTVSILAGSGGSSTAGVYLSGKVLAGGATTGGQISISGPQLDLYGAELRADGATGGGRIRLGGDFHGQGTLPAASRVAVNAASRLSADAVTQGSGGSVVVWAQEQTRFAGQISAKGGALGGDGGQVEVSGKAGLAWQGKVDVTAPAGRAGALLLDPKNLLVAGPAFNEFGDPNPGTGGNQFGAQVVPLSTGNVVITSPYDDTNGTDTGAVYLFDGVSGALISALVGSTAGDRVGSGGVTALSSGDFVVRSPLWDNGTATDAGAVTWGSDLLGFPGAIFDVSLVGTNNSLVGTNTNDQIGSDGVFALRNGNYVVASVNWNGGRGAVTWGDGAAGVVGAVTSINSLTGATAGDRVGYGVTVLPNGNYVVTSPNWNGDLGAATWCDGGAPTTVLVSESNSLVGVAGGDSIGSKGVFALSNGNYLVRSPKWSNGGVANAGAVTFGDGTSGIVGPVSESNSLVGASADDGVGDLATSVVELSNGNFVICSPLWDWYDAVNLVLYPNAGAVTFGSGTSGVIGAVSETNSLIGSAAGDSVGSNGVFALANDNHNYVVCSAVWDDGASADVGAVTLGDGTTGIVGKISDANNLAHSLVGYFAGDLVGYGGATPLTNGNYVVKSPYWSDGVSSGVGAITWGDGTTGVTGSVSNTNSLVGTSANDNVGLGGVFALSNGNFVVASPMWDNGAIVDAGAVTWADGTTGLTGEIFPANSLVGSTASDRVGSGGVTVLSLPSGSYVVASPFWASGALSDAGAATWGNAVTGIHGTISSSNSLVGASANSTVGSLGVTALDNGNYVVGSSNGTLGAATWGSGTTGVTGLLSAANSLVGTTPSDNVGAKVVALENGNYVVVSPAWHNGGSASAGAATWANGAAGITGTISTVNSLLGTTPNTGLTTVVSDTVNEFFYAAFPAEAGAAPGGKTYGGRVRLASLTSGVFPTLTSQIFADHSGQTVTISPNVGETLSIGTAVTLQASNDITVNNAIAANNSADVGGDLTLQAGRNLFLNDDIFTDDGNLNLTANDTVANGVVDADRDSGNAVITMALGTTLNVGAGTLTINLRDSTDKTNNARGVATLQDVTAAATVLGSGTVLANGTINSPVSVQSGATLGGSGSIEGPVSLVSGGIVAPGDAGPSQLSTRNLTFVNGSALNVDINGVTAGSQYDQLRVTGAVSLSNATLTVNLAAALGGGHKLTLIDNDDFDAVLGTFKGLPEGTLFSVGSSRFHITYRGGDGNDVVLLSREIYLAPNSLPENQPAGKVVGSLSSSYPADPRDTSSFALVPGAGDTDNNWFTLVGRELRAGSTFDYETKNAYSVRVRAIDTSGLWYEQALTVSVTDMFTTPTVTIVNAGGVYNGSPFAVTDALVIGTSDADVLARFGSPSLSYRYYSGATLLPGAPKNVGSYTVVAHYTSSSLDYASVDSAALAFSIAPAPLSVLGITADNKVYDRTTNATVHVGTPMLSGLVPGDVVALDVATVTGAFGDKNVGTAKTVNLSGLSISGAQAGNYILVPTTTANITPLLLGISGVTAEDKVYDGTTTAVGGYGSIMLSGVLSGDTVTPDAHNATANFVTKFMGINKAVNVTGLALAGADGGNYSLPPVSTTASITAPDYVYLNGKQDYAVGSHPEGVATADFNSDGRPDLVVANAASNTVTVYLDTTVGQAAQATFSAGQSFAVGSGAYSVTAGDFNGDGRADVAVANAGGDTVSVLVNKTVTGASLAAFAPQQQFGTGTTPSAIAVGDFNGDGMVDIVVTNTNATKTQSVSVLLNKTTAGAAAVAFAARRDFETGSMPIGLGVGDLNNDGRLDILTSNVDAGAISVLLNSTHFDSTLQQVVFGFAPRVNFGAGEHPGGVALGDLNADGYLDVAVTDTQAGVVSVLFNRSYVDPVSGSTVFDIAPRQTFATPGATPGYVAISDLSGNGRRDLVVTSRDADTVSVFLNATTAGASTFTMAKRYDFATGSQPAGVVLPDLNSDGRPDVVAVNSGASSFSVLMNGTHLPNNTTVGVYDSTTSKFYLKYYNSEGGSDLSFGFGVPGWKPMAGDWNGDGVDTIGLFQPEAAQVYLRNSNSSGPADVSFGFGNPAEASQYILVVGDWNGDGVDTIGLYHRASGTWFLRNTNSEGMADVTFGFGVPGSNWLPVVGDWDGNGVDTIGLYDPSTGMFYLRNSLSTGMADTAFPYGVPNAGWTPLIGDWNGDCLDSAGFYQPGAASHFYLRNAFNAGPADVHFGFGFAGALPIAGNWNGLVGMPLTAATAGALTPAVGATLADTAMLAPVVSQALARWAAAGTWMSTPQIVITDLPDSQVGETRGATIYLDRDAAGHGWFVDPTPAADEEFYAAGNQLKAVDPQAVDRIDLLTVIEHELGHLTGLPDLDPTLDDLMSGVLPVGVRRK